MRCGNVTVKVNANRFLFQKANLPVLIIDVTAQPRLKNGAHFLTKARNAFRKLQCNIVQIDYETINLAWRLYL